ncbi:conjugal transfer protein MobA [Chryseobacterium polytrichastri]|uniref:MobA protein n=1 Tax=Chryseobacterium polytrichastri TaxID=1302687 RepID=A0A1M6VM76_9FLAO|nr:conjugal transfer protein MobA [Chryseobacterium polytrichastri]SHK82598.1 hypothetical protein SAMN05444267_100878 [Chryseobacterium polytrichastri]
MDKKDHHYRNRGGRKPKINPSIYRHVFRLTNEENIKMMKLFEASAFTNKAKFIVSVLFSREIRTVKIDKGSMDFYMRLTSLYTQFRAVGVNYNQVVKVLYTNYSEQKVTALLNTLEKQTVEMTGLCQKIIKLTEEFELQYLKK